MGNFDLLDWFTGGERHPYMTLTHCMAHDYTWIAVTVALDLAVATGYAVIARHWWINQRRLAGDSSPRRALGRMRNIFVFCGICGYLFIPIKMIWPAWRLYDLVMVGLAYSTWRYAWSAKDLKVVYDELHRSGQLAKDLEESRAESRRKTEFFNAISHDLRTPLNGLALQAALAEDYLARSDADGLRDALAEIRAGTRSTAEMLNHLLELGRLDWSRDTVDPTAFPLDVFLERLVDRSRASANVKGLTLCLSAPAGVDLFADRLTLERIVQNLLQNAIKFTQRGTIEVTAVADGQGVAISVRDSGIGIAPEHLDRIFEDFYQVQNRERDRDKGYGIGLGISHRLARKLGGELRVESELGRGSCFTLRLPRSLLAAGRRGGEAVEVCG